MSQATANRVKVGVIREVTPGTTPTSPKVLNYRLLSVGLKANIGTKQSGEIVSDRMIADVTPVSKIVDGPLGFELSYHANFTAMDKLLESAFWNAWTKTPECDNNENAAAVGNITLTTDIAVTTGQNWKQDQLLRATGFTNAGNNRILQALASTSGTVVKTTSAVNETTPATARLKCIGVQARSAADVTAVTAGGNGLSSTSTDFTQHGLVVGMWVLLGTNAARAGGTDNFSFAITPANNGWCRIGATPTTTTLKFDIVPTGWAVDAATGKTIRIFFGDYLRNGTTAFFHSIEQQATDVGMYSVFKGCMVDQMKITFPFQDLITGEFQFKGFDELAQNSRSLTTPTDVAAPSNDVLNTSSNVGRLAEGGSVITGSPGNYITNFEFTIDNATRGLPAVGQLGVVGVNPGTFDCDGTAEFYFADLTIKNKALNNTQTSLDLSVQDAAGNAYTIDIPKCKFTAAPVDVGGLNSESKVKAEWQALKYMPAAGSAYSAHFQRSELAGTNA